MATWKCSAFWCSQWYSKSHTLHWGIYLSLSSTFIIQCGWNSSTLKPYFCWWHNQITFKCEPCHCMITLKIMNIFLISNFCCVLKVVFFSFGWIPGVWILSVDVSEHSVCSRRCKQDEIPVILPAYTAWNRQCSEMSAHTIQMLGNHPQGMSW